MTSPLKSMIIPWVRRELGYGHFCLYSIQEGCFLDEGIQTARDHKDLQTQSLEEVELECISHLRKLCRVGCLTNLHLVHVWELYLNACDADTVDGQGTLALFISLFSVNRDEDLGLEDRWEEGGRKLSVPNPMS